MMKGQELIPTINLLFSIVLDLYAFFLVICVKKNYGSFNAIQAFFLFFLIFLFFNAFYSWSYDWFYKRRCLLWLISI